MQDTVVQILTNARDLSFLFNKCQDYLWSPPRLFSVPWDSFPKVVARELGPLLNNNYY